MGEQAGLRFLAGGGQLGALMRAHDWSASPLGSPDGWPQSLRSVAGLLLTSRFPMFVAWGDERGLLYNDAYAEILGTKHPAALGRRFRDVWSEIWSDITPLIDAALAGEAVYRENLPLVLNRSGDDEQAWFTFSYSPVRDESGQIAGLFCAVTETTRMVLADRRNAFLIELGDRIRDLQDPKAVMDAAAEALGHRFGGVRAGWAEVTAEGDHTGIEGHWHANGVAPVVGRYRLDADGSAFASDYRAGRTVVVSDYETDPRSAGRAAAMHAAEIVVPLVKDRCLTALFFVQAAAPRRWTRAEVALAEDVAERTWAAVERVRAVAALHGSEVRLRELNETLESQVEARTRELAGSEARFRAYFDASPENLFLARMPRDGNLVFDDLNQAAEGLYGLSRDAVVGRGPAEILDPVTAADIEDRARECLLRGQPLRYEAVRRFQSGHALVLNVVAAPLPVAEGRDPLILFCGRDMTEQRQAEEALRQSQKMEAVGQLTGGIAHDFNNMLQAIGSSLELMGRRVEQGRTEDVPRFAATARTTVDRAAALTHRLLAFARRQTLLPEPVIADALILGMDELMRQTVGPAIVIDRRMCDGNWPVLCDPNQLENVLLNLVINARDAMPLGGTLTITTRHVSLTAGDVTGQDGAAPGDFVEISVADTGTGMDEATRARAFEPFFTTKPLGQGTGLGLSQLYGFVRQSGGIVRLDSAPGRGTTVHLLLPRQESVPDPEREPVKAEPVAIGTGGTVLLVEDETEVRIAAAEHLRDLGWAVLEAVNGTTALSVLRSASQLDLLVTDVGLPGGLNGRQVADAARELRPGLRVLFITGYAGSVLEEQLAPGMDVIGKPFALGTLADRLRSMVSRPQQ